MLASVPASPPLDPLLLLDELLLLLDDPPLDPLLPLDELLLDPLLLVDASSVGTTGASPVPPEHASKRTPTAAEAAIEAKRMGV